jgi:hypothetical protein
MGRILTSRSRIVAYANCPRLGYLTYDWGETGLEPVSLSLPLANGIAIHEILAAILTGTAPAVAISKALADYEALVHAHGVVNEDPTSVDWLIQEQRTLLEGMIHAWLRVRYPVLRSEYDFLAVERELLWPLDAEGTIIDQIRCDVLARRKSDGGLFYLEWKTTTTGGDEWVKQWEHNTQLLANTLAVEELLHERCEGVLIEGLLKGRRKIDEAARSPFQGRKIQFSPLTYGYKHVATGEFSARYQGAKGWYKIATWQEMPVETWVSDVMTVEDCQGLFAPVPPIRPRRAHLDRWRGQTIALEQERAARLQILKTRPEALDTLFPMNDEHCFRYWGHPCPFEPLCFGDEVAQDPLGSGLYQPRQPHHDVPPEED